MSERWEETERKGGTPITGDGVLQIKIMINRVTEIKEMVRMENVCAL